MDATYIFPGQGAQYVGMGRDLYEACPEAKEIFDKACDIIKFDLKNLCFEGPEEELSNTYNSQAAIFTHSMAALKALEARRGLEFTPKFGLGLSLGEFTAIAASGALTFEEGISLVRRRGKFMDEASQKNPGKMVSILGLDLDSVEGLVKGIGNCWIANLNCPGQIVVSGKTKNVELLASLAKEKGAKRVIELDVSGAFHSAVMAPAKEKLDKEMGKIIFKAPRYPVISNITGLASEDPAEIKRNLSLHMVSRTYFEKSIRLAASSGIDTFLEIGPGAVLKGLLRKIDPKLKVMNFDKAQDFAAPAL